MSTLSDILTCIPSRSLPQHNTNQLAYLQSTAFTMQQFCPSMMISVATIEMLNKCSNHRLHTWALFYKTARSVTIKDPDILGPSVYNFHTASRFGMVVGWILTDNARLQDFTTYYERSPNAAFGNGTRTAFKMLHLTFDRLTDISVSITPGIHQTTHTIQTTSQRKV